ncbi:MAG: ribonuclease E inhibitor RraB [Armatimonadota bacterium]
MSMLWEADGMDDREADNALIDELIELGIDLGRPREVRFHFVFDNESSAESVAARLTHDDYACEVTEMKPNIVVRLFKKSEWLVSATKVMVVDCYIISELRTEFSAIMAETNGFYDGWEVEVFPEEQNAL